MLEALNDVLKGLHHELLTVGALQVVQLKMDQCLLQVFASPLLLTVLMSPFLLLSSFTSHPHCPQPINPPFRKVRMETSTNGKLS